MTKYNYDEYDSDSDYSQDDDYNGYATNNEDGEFNEIMHKRKQLHEEFLADLEVTGRHKIFDGLSDLKDYYQDSDDADSPLSSEDDNDRMKKKKKKMKYPKHNARTSNNEVVLEFSKLYSDKKQLTKALLNYRVYNGYALRTIKSDRKRLEVACKSKGCEWTMWARKLPTEESWQISTMPKPHTCVHYNYEKGMGRLSSNWLAEEFKESFRLQPSLKLWELSNMIESKYLSKPTMSMCVRTRTKALTLLLGDYKAQFGMVRDYANELIAKNPNSTVKITVGTSGEEKSVFKSIYICVDSLKRGFLEGCRKVLCIDGCFLKGPWNGQVLAVVGRDANNQMYPVAWGVAQRENKDTWMWFMQFLCQDLDMKNGQGWTIISDQQKGLVDAISYYLPEAEHRLCARHVYANLRKKWKGVQYRDVFWRLAKSSNEVDYQHNVKEMQDLDIRAWQFLERKDPKHFCRLFFKSNAKCDSVDNNMAEIFNASIIEARFKLIVTMLEDIYESIMARVAIRKSMALNLQQDICPAILKKLDKAIDQSRFWLASIGGDGMFKVKHGTEGFVVNMYAKSCTCKAWDLSGIPCAHSITTMRKVDMTPTQFIHECYTTEMLKITYAHTLKPLNGSNLWVSSQCDPILAPQFKEKKRGTLQFKRMLEEGETRARGPYGVVPKSGGTVKCSKCSGLGHNRKTCTQRVSTSTVNSCATDNPSMNDFQEASNVDTHASIVDVPASNIIGCQGTDSILQGTQQIGKLQVRRASTSMMMNEEVFSTQQSQTFATLDEFCDFEF